MCILNAFKIGMDNSPQPLIWAEHPWASSAEPDDIILRQAMFLPQHRPNIIPEKLLHTQGSKGNIPCCALLVRQVRTTFASDSRMWRAHPAWIWRLICHASLVPVVSHLRGARNKGCYFWTPLYVGRLGAVVRMYLCMWPLSNGSSILIHTTGFTRAVNAQRSLLNRRTIWLLQGMTLVGYFWSRETVAQGIVGSSMEPSMDPVSRLCTYK
jgi:hypothetical protein